MQEDNKEVDEALGTKVTAKGANNKKGKVLMRHFNKVFDKLSKDDAKAYYSSMTNFDYDGAAKALKKYGFKAQTLAKIKEDTTMEHEVDEALDAKQRMAKKMAMKKNKAKIKIGKKKALKKVANPEKLKKMAMKKARDMIAKKLVKGKSKSDMGMAQKQGLEKKLDKKKSAIKKLAKKILPKIKKANKEKVKKHKANKD
jgi:hypothetical protein